MTVPTTFTASNPGFGRWQRPFLVGLSVLVATPAILLRQAGGAQTDA